MTYLLHDEVAYFQQLHEVEQNHWWSRAMWQIASGLVAKALRGRYGLHALDVGCGAGGTLRKLASLPQIERVTGIDPSPAALDMAADWNVAQASALAIPSQDCSFDLVTCFDVLQHLEPGEDTLAIQEIHRVLRPNGIAILRTNGQGLWPDRSRSDVLYNLRILRNIARDSGFLVSHSSYANCLPSIGAEILGRVSSWTAKNLESSNFGHPQGRGLRIRKSNRTLDRLMGAITSCEGVAITRLGLSLPVGHSIVMLLRKPGGPDT